MILTAENYYEKNNRALTCSKIKDFMKCPHYFYRKHIACEIEDDEKPSFIFGTIVDKLLSGEEFDKKYEVADGIRTAKKKADAEERGVTLLTPNDYNEVIEVADAIEKTDAWKFIKEKDFKFQDIIQNDFAKPRKHFDCVAGRPDAYHITKDNICHLVDIKTSVSVDPKRYYYLASGFKYDYQLAMYEFLLSYKYPNIKEFISYNLAVSKEKNVYSVELFEFPREMILKAKADLLEQMENITRDDQEFKKYNPSFDKPNVLGSFMDPEPMTEEGFDKQ